MGNYRRNQSGAVRFVPALKAVLLCTLIGGSCVGYVMQKKKIFELGQQIGESQRRLDKLKKENQVLADRLAAMQSPQRLAERVKELKLGLVPPQRQQIVWISEQPSASPGWPSAGSNAPSMQFVQSRQKP